MGLSFNNIYSAFPWCQAYVPGAKVGMCIPAFLRKRLKLREVRDFVQKCLAPGTKALSSYAGLMGFSTLPSLNHHDY